MKKIFLVGFFVLIFFSGFFWLTKRQPKIVTFKAQPRLESNNEASQLANKLDFKNDIDQSDQLKVSTDESTKSEKSLLPDDSTQDGNQSFLEKKEVQKEEVQKEKEDFKKEDDSDKKKVEIKNEKDKVFSIKNQLVNWGYSVKNSRKIDTIIIHSSYDALGGDPYSVSGLIDVYKKYSVAAHFLIDREGKIYQLVKEEDIAYHAGESKMPDGRTGVNEFSIGIELMNTKEDSYESIQYQALNWLIEIINKEYSINYILGHNQIAPERKTDPWNFDWNKIN